MAYCEDDDLVKIRPEILSYGQSDWEDQISEATAAIDRVIISRWYNRVAPDFGIDPKYTVFDSSLLLNSATQLTRLCCYKALELIYLYLMKDTADADAFERQQNIFRTLYNDELSNVLDAGLDYDWDGSGGITYTERQIPRYRRLSRA